MGFQMSSGNFFADTSLESVRWKRQYVVGSPGALVGIGTSLTNSGTVSTTAATSTSASGNTYTTGSVSGNSAGQLCDAIHSTGHFLRCAWQITVTSIATCRYWLGFTNGTVANMVDSDTPAFSYLGFRFSTAAGDSNWQCAADNGSGAPTITNSGVAVAAGEYILGITTTPSASAASFFIGRVATGAPSLKANIFTAKVPSTATLLAQFSGIETLSAAAKNYSLHFINGRSRIL